MSSLLQNHAQTPKKLVASYMIYAGDVLIFTYYIVCNVHWPLTNFEVWNALGLLLNHFTMKK